MNQKIVLKKQVLVVFVLLLSASAFISCEKYVYDPPKVDLTTPVSFQNDILPIFSSNNCTSCHGGGLDPDLRASNAYNSLINGGYVNTTNPASSVLYTTLKSSPHNTRCSVQDQNKILAWITQGALNDSSK